MSVLEFIADLVGSLAWPAGVILLAVVFRREVTALLQRVTEIRRGDTSVRFAEKLEEAQEEAAGIYPSMGAHGADADRDGLLVLTELSPRAGLIESWVRLEESARRAVEHHDLPKPARSTLLSHLRTLATAGLISSEYEALARDLVALRNTAAHDLDFNLPPEQAREVVELVLTMAVALEALTAL